MMFLSPVLGFWMMVFFSIVISLSGHSLFFMYLSLEFNMISILPILNSLGSVISSEISLKYFISQSIASILFLLFYFFSILSTSYFFFMLTMVLLFKLGLPPFHSWLSSILFSSPYKIIFILLVVQKFIPLHILSNLNNSLGLITLIFIMTLLFILSLMNKMFSIRMMLLMSAWGNSIWLVLSAMTSMSWIIYLFFYGCFLWLLLSLFHENNIQHFSSFLNTSFLAKITICLNFLNLAGLPPFSGFFLKFLLLKSFSHLPYILITALLFFSLANLFIYLSVSYYILSSSFFFSLSKPFNYNFFTVLPSTIFLFSIPLFLMTSI